MLDDVPWTVAADDADAAAADVSAWVVGLARVGDERRG